MNVNLKDITAPQCICRAGAPYRSDCPYSTPEDATWLSWKPAMIMRNEKQGDEAEATGESDSFGNL